MDSATLKPKAVKIGDTVCFFSEEKYGFLYALQTSSIESCAAVRPNQDRVDPALPDPHVVCWRVVVGSRYKLRKKLTKLAAHLGMSENYHQCQGDIKKMKDVYEAEERDNQSEQKKHTGSPLFYGQIIELYNLYTSCYLHVSSTKPSHTAKGHLKVEMHPYHAKQSQFRVMPKFKVRSEGDIVLVDDHVILESIKSPGHYLHVSSEVFPKGRVHENSHEISLSAAPSGFTVYRSSSINRASPNDCLLKGGDVIRLYHKEIESYLCAEGSFGPKAEITSDGEPLCWINHVRLRHPVTRHYLKVLSDERSTITEDKDDPYTVFKLHSVVKTISTKAQNKLTSMIERETFCRIENVMTGSWLHAKAEDFHSTHFKKRTNLPKQEFLWTTAQKRNVGVSVERLFADVFTIQPVDDDLLRNFRYISGLIPNFKELIQMEVEEPGYLHRHEATVLAMLRELKMSMIVDDVPCKKRQKFLRNLRFIEVLVDLLQLCANNNRGTNDYVTEEIYEVLRVYAVGNSRKNELYLARHLDFFITRLTDTATQSSVAAKMMRELVLDNIKIIERITQKQIRTLVKFLKLHKDYRHLQLLGTLCVCEGVGHTENQRFITDAWLIKEVKKCVFHTALGQAIGKDLNTLYVSKDNRQTWTSIFDMLEDAKYGSHNDIAFLEAQLDLFDKLCHGKNTYAIDMITEELKHLTWEEALCCLTDTNLPAYLRARFCHLIEVMFMNTEDITANLDHLKLTFIYHEQASLDQLVTLTPAGNEEEALLSETEFRQRVETLQNWIEQFLTNHTQMVLNQVEENMLIGKVLSLVRQLVKLGYYGDSERMRALLLPLLQLIDGRNDAPFDVSKEASLESDEVKNFRNEGRYKRSKQADHVIEAKQCGLEILEMFLNLRFNKRLEGFVEEFKLLHAHFYNTETEAERERKEGIVVDLDVLSEDPEETEEDVLIEMFTKGPSGVMADKEKKEIALRNLNTLFVNTAILKGFGMDSVLLDLCQYEYRPLVRKAISLLVRIFSAHDYLFSKAVQSQILLTETSCTVYANVVNMLPPLRRISMARLEESQTDILDQFLDVLIGYCTLENDPTTAHSINQRIIYNQGILSDLFVILTQETLPDQDNYRGVRAIQRKTWKLVGALTKGNPTVQIKLYDRLEVLLNIKGAESNMALALSEIFHNNKLTCMKITFPQVQMIMNLISQHQMKVPELFDLLKSILKYEELDIPFRRNQEYIIKCFTQRRTEVAGMLDRDQGERLAILREGKGQATHYLTSLIDLLASCAERGSAFTESLCQSILSVDELLELLNDQQILDHVKRPLLRFFHHVYFSFTDQEGQAILDYMTDKRLWNFLLMIRTKFLSSRLYADKCKDEVRELMKKDLRQVVWEEEVAPETLDTLLDEDDLSVDSRQDETASARGESSDLLTQHRSLHYIMDSVLPFLQSFYTCAFVRRGRRSKREAEVAHHLAKGLQAFVDSVGPLLSRQEHQKILVATHRTLLSATRVPLHMMEALQSKISLARKGPLAKMNTPKKNYQDYYKLEIDINMYFDTFARSYQTLYNGENTVTSQLGLKCGREYMVAGSEEELPLGGEFQSLVNRFINEGGTNSRTQYANTKVLIRQLAMEERLMTPAELEFRSQENLDVKCLQILRAMLHNEIILVDPAEPLPISLTTRKHLQKIKEIQEFFVQAGAIEKALLHLDSSSEAVVREVFAFLAVVLYEGNRKVQDRIYKYLSGKRDEKFFTAVRHRLQQSALGIKERKRLENQHESLIDETVRQVKKLKDLVRTGSLGKADFSIEVNSTVRRTSSSLRAEDLKMSLDELSRSRSQNQAHGSLSNVREINTHLGDPDRLSTGMVTPKLGKKVKGARVGDQYSVNTGGTSDDWYDAEDMDENQIGNDLKRMVHSWLEDLPLRGESSLSLMLKVIRLMCEGQYELLQDYLRIQPDNYMSVNIVSEIVALIQMVVSNKKQPGPKELLIELIHTLSEMVAGNAENKALIVDSRICDLIKEMMEDEFAERLTAYDVLRLRDAFGNLISCLLTSVSNDINTAIPMLVCQSINHKRLAMIVEESYRAEKNEESSLEVRKLARDVGFSFYHLLNHIEDLIQEEELTYKCLKEFPNEKDVIKHYSESTLSVEIEREGTLHRLYFPCDYQGALQEHVKEAFNYGVAREGTERIGEYMQWSKELREDIWHTRKLSARPFTRFIMKADFWLNMTMMGVSAVMVVLMTAFWVANPTDLYTPIPDYRFEWARPLMLAVAIIHFFVTVPVMVSFFIINNPRAPTIIERVYRKLKEGGDYNPDIVDYREPTTQHIRISLISFRTFWYILLFGLSLGGIFVHHFLVFHLLHMANYIQLLKRAINAITQNGQSLILIYLFSLVFFTIFALINFAFYRDIFMSSEGTYCTTFYECWVTTHHHGLIAGLYEGIPPPEGDPRPFTWMLHKATVDLIFFALITTIILNMVFGVILDTFAQLRDEKWTIDNQMLAHCFICGRDSYDFERKPGGFERHVKYDHNQWAYIFFFMYLGEKQKNNLTALEAYVRQKLEMQEYDFLPKERAMVLEETNSKESLTALQMLESRMAIFVKRVVELESELDQQKIINEQKEWMEEYRKLAQHKDFDAMATTAGTVRSDRVVTFRETPGTSYDI